MPQTIIKGYKALVDDATKEITTLSIAEAQGLLADPEVVMVDLRDPRELERKRFVFFCGGGWRSALAAKTAQDMGLKPVAHIDGGFSAWKKAGAPIVSS
jgi:rhodanese-related sulfurtransferase